MGLAVSLPSSSMPITTVVTTIAPAWVQSLTRRLWPPTCKILLLGLANAGKTTVLHQFKHGRCPDGGTIPTTGFQVETVAWRGTEFTIWDICGQRGGRALWEHFAGPTTDAVIFVVDAADHERLIEMRQELEAIVACEALAHARLLVLANKQDLPRAMAPGDIGAHLLGLPDKRPRMHVLGAIAQAGDGLFEALEWLCRELIEADAA